MNSPFDHLEAGIWGLLVGDAAGVPYEFHAAADIPPMEKIQMIPPADFDRSYAHIPPGTWSDDGAQALCLAASLLDHPHFEIEDFARRLLDWASEGSMAVDNHVFDIGIQTGEALSRLRTGMRPEEAGLAGERNNGNGSLMRVLPAALLHRGSTKDLVRVACAQSTVTHAHPRSLACCGLYCLWARFEMEKHPSAWLAAVEEFLRCVPPGSDLLAETEQVILPAMDRQPTGSGYVVDALVSALAACRETDCRRIIQKAISFGNDTDTTACIAGGIAGIRHGLDGIPKDWRDQLRGRAILEEILLTAKVRLTPPEATSQ